MADRRRVDLAARNHDLADDALQPAEGEQQQVPRQLPQRNGAAHDEPGHRQREEQAEKTAQQAVQVLEPENALEIVDVEMRIHLDEFGRLLVDLEYALPFGVARRRNGAHDRPPLGHRQAGPRKARDAAEHDHRENERAAREQPGRNLAVVSA